LSVDCGTTTTPLVSRSPLGLCDCMDCVERGEVSSSPRFGGSIRGAGHLIQVARSVGRVGRSVGSDLHPQRQVWGNDKSGETSSVSVGVFSRGICGWPRSPDADSVCLPYNHELVILFFFCPFDLHIHTMYGWRCPSAARVLRSLRARGLLCGSANIPMSFGPHDGISRGEHNCNRSSVHTRRVGA